ncbi:RNA polymerase sigma factor [Clostridium estertheticum]|uniref:RNA polymerase sigma factor n=1 Tax=Clostridium estertheticum TaxID=238834 RepID=UPI0013E97512|nr:RNA polymerase sigma factor [Clostridium estertheticum]MBZ9685206.1 RNA polymerase sigma factor [Clostridium estertheticum]
MEKNCLQQEIAEYVIRYKENHYRLAYSYVKNADDAMDIVQESIYKAIASIDSLKSSSSIKTWFYRIIVNTSLDFLRKQRKVSVVEDETMLRLDSGVLDEYENFDLQRELDNLPDDYRTIIKLRYFEDLKIGEIAEILNENLSTVKSRLYKALEILKLK